MKKLLIFLMLFAFGIAGYCFDQTYTFNSSDRYDYWLNFATLPAGTYNFQMISSTFSSSTIAIADGVSNWTGLFPYGDAHCYEYNSLPGPIASATFTSSQSLTFHRGWSTGVATFTFRIWNDEPDPVSPTITSSLSLSKITGQSFSYTITATGDPTITYSASNLPAGFTFSGSTITGTVPASNFSFDISATNSAGSDTETVNVSVSAGVPPDITSSLSVNGDAGQAFAYSVTATGTSPITYGASNLPSFLSFNGSTVSGTIPTGQTVDFSFDISATNSAGSDTETVNVHAIAGQPPVITSPVTVSATSGTAFSYSITATGGTPITFSAAGLPSYLSYSNGVVSGTLPASIEPVSFSFTVGATNIFGSDSKVVTVNATAGNNGQFDSDDDVPAINAMKEAIISSLSAIKEDTYNTAQGWSQWGVLWAQFVTNYMTPIRGMSTTLDSFLDSYEIYEESKALVIADLSNDVTSILDVLTNAIGTSVVDIKSDTGVIKTQVTEINNKLTNIDTNYTNMADLLSSVNVNITANAVKLDNIKGVLDESLLVQQNQLTTQQDQLLVQQNQLIVQQDILTLLDQIANPEEVPNPAMPDNPDDPPAVTPSFEFTFDKESNSGDLQKYSKEFPMFDTAFRQRQGVLDYRFLVPLSQVSPLLEDRYVNFTSGTVGDFVSGIRAILACILFYFTLKYWFNAVRRLTD